METAYTVCALVGGTLIVCQFVLTLFGLGGDHDLADDVSHDIAMDADASDGSGHDVGHGSQSSWFFGVLSFKALTAAFAFFGLAGLGVKDQLQPLPTLGVALLAGVSAMFMVAKIMHMLVKLNVDGTVRIERSVGARGTVYLAIPPGRSGAGKVQVCVYNRTLEYNAVTPQDALPTGAPIVVVRVVNGDTVEVASATNSELPNHV